MPGGLDAGDGAGGGLPGALSPAFCPGANPARSTFLHPGVRERTESWEQVADLVARTLEESLHRSLEDARFRSLVGELAARSGAFSTAWARRHVPPGGGAVAFTHPLVGRLLLAHQELRART
ncbi:MmyB family transcriptional regulator [Kineococcus indalonis]|uniref:MmyB family transcriptional regulator n=1 Tax=Kineococcus indalonis TaxID=2696566 RepID=UPI0014121266|nr:hypothetical protein [Kineococcus indalonis]NAZ84880.1 hypothetical protein [Kineococcus indalonis]